MLDITVSLASIRRAVKATKTFYAFVYLMCRIVFKSENAAFFSVKGKKNNSSDGLQTLKLPSNMTYGFLGNLFINVDHFVTLSFYL